MKDRLARTLAIGSSVLTVLTAAFAGWQAAVSQRADDRASGRAEARATVVAADQLQPFRATPKLGDKPMPGWGSVDKLDELIAVDAAIVVKNEGDAPIDAVRLEVRFDRGFIDSIGRDDLKEDPAPWAFRQTDVDDLILPHKLRPGEAIRIPVTRGVVAQMLQQQSTIVPDRRHFGIFFVRCSVRLVGATHFDLAASPEPCVLSVAWLPRGFPKERSEQYLREARPLIADDRRFGK